MARALGPYSRFSSSLLFPRQPAGGAVRRLSSLLLMYLHPPGLISGHALPAPRPARGTAQPYQHCAAHAYLSPALAALEFGSGV